VSALTIGMPSVAMSGAGTLYEPNKNIVYFCSNCDSVKVVKSEEVSVNSGVCDNCGLGMPVIAMTPLGSLVVMKEEDA